MKKTNFRGLDDAQRKLVIAARAATNQAYAPYSHFFVGAALLTIDGKIITGANVENASYGLTICAERAALVRANAEGHRKFYKMALIVRGEKGPAKKASAPCGACRQFIAEFAKVGGYDMEIIMSNTDRSQIVVAKMSELLPMGFDSNDLG